MQRYVITIVAFAMLFIPVQSLVHAENVIATAGNYTGWVLDFDNNLGTVQLGGWTSSRNPVVTQSKTGNLPSGATWRIFDVGNGQSVIEATAGNYRGWVLDFDNDRGTVQLGGWTSSRNLVLTRPKNNGDVPSGAKWRIFDVGNGQSVIKATAGNYRGWVLDFDNDRGAVQLGGWTSSRSLVLTRPKNNGDVPSGARWRSQ